MPRVFRRIRGIKTNDQQPLQPPPIESKTVDKYEGKTRQQWWEDKFKKQAVLYKAQYNSVRDVRNFIFDQSYILEDVIKRYKLKGIDDNDTVFKCYLFVLDHIKYVSDEVSKGQPEYWKYPEDTLNDANADCEDMAILIKSLSLCAGVPDWKVKILAGMVKEGGHAFCTYIRDDDTQCILDSAYWPNRLLIENRPSIKDETNYKEIFFSFNRKYSYAVRRTLYDESLFK